jgi:hypothetical protein
MKNNNFKKYKKINHLYIKDTNLNQELHSNKIPKLY